MSETDAFAEIERTFPARGLSVKTDAARSSPIFGFERNCAKCGQPFISYAEHVYKHDAAQRGHKRTSCYFCSYNCMRAWERDREAELRRRKAK